MEESWVHINSNNIEDRKQQQSMEGNPQIVREDGNAQKQETIKEMTGSSQWLEELKEDLSQLIRSPNCPEEMKHSLNASLMSASARLQEWTMPAEIEELCQQRKILEETSQVLKCPNATETAKYAMAVVAEMNELREQVASLETTKDSSKMAEKGAKLLQYRQVVEALRDILSSTLPVESGTLTIEQMPEVLSDLVKKNQHPGVYSSEGSRMKASGDCNTPEVNPGEKDCDTQEEAQVLRDSQLLADISALQQLKSDLESQIQYKENQAFNKEKEFVEMTNQLKAETEKCQSLSDELDNIKQQYRDLQVQVQQERDQFKELKEVSEQLFNEHTKLLKERGQAPVVQHNCEQCKTKEKTIQNLHEHLNKLTEEKDQEVSELQKILSEFHESQSQEERNTRSENDGEVESLCQMLSAVNQTQVRGCPKCQQLRAGALRKLDEVRNVPDGNSPSTIQVLICHILEELLKIERAAEILKGDTNSDIAQESIARIMEMGYSAEEAKVALQSCGDSVDAALEMILAGNLPLTGGENSAPQNLAVAFVNSLTNIKDHIHSIHSQQFEEARQRMPERHSGMVAEDTKQEDSSKISVSRLKVGDVAIFLPKGPDEFYALSTDENARYRLSQDSKNIMGQHGFDPTFYNSSIAIGSIFLITNQDGEDASRSQIIDTSSDFMFSNDPDLDNEPLVYDVSVFPASGFHW